MQTIKRSFSTMSTGVAALAEWLADHEVTTAVMEATGVYWKPIYYGLEGLVSELWLVNAEILDHIAFLDAAIARLTAEIVERTAPF